MLGSAGTSSFGAGGYRRWRRLVFAFTLLYVVISLGSLVILARKSKNEVFPIFSWALFCFIPQQEQDYGIRVIQGGDATPATPRYIERTDFPGANSPALYMVIQDMGHALRQGQDDTLDTKRKILETNYLPPDSAVRYELVRREFDVLERYRDGTFRHIEVLGTFSSRGAS